MVSLRPMTKEEFQAILTPILLRGSLASENSEHIKLVESISNIISYGVLKKLLA